MADQKQGGDLRIEAISVAYGGIGALADVGLEVRRGEFLGVLGANGAGKSTLLKTISGLVRPSTGSIVYNGVNLLAQAPHRIPACGVAHVPERRRVFASMTVYDNLILGGYVHKASRRDTGALEEILELFPRLRERASQLAGSLSGGEQQMLAVGRALMLRPSLLMLDEPSLGLAPIVVEQMFERLSTIHRELGISILLVEQNASQALEVITRGVVLENGRVTFVGDTAELAETEYLTRAYLGI
jgi:branched-chain amino acid transport system ATP-binding protein